MTLMENTAPERSLEQRRAALAHANAIRSFRAQLKRDIAAGRELASDWLADPVHEMVESMKVWDLLLAVPKVGRVKVNKVLRDLKVSSSKTIGGLSSRQRAELVGVLAGRERTMRR